MLQAVLDMILEVLKCGIIECNVRRVRRPIIGVEMERNRRSIKGVEMESYRRSIIVLKWKAFCNAVHIRCALHGAD